MTPPFPNFRLLADKSTAKLASTPDGSYQAVFLKNHGSTVGTVRFYRTELDGSLGFYVSQFLVKMNLALVKTDGKKIELELGEEEETEEMSFEGEGKMMEVELSGAGDTDLTSHLTNGSPGSLNTADSSLQNSPFGASGRDDHVLFVLKILDSLGEDPLMYCEMRLYYNRDSSEVEEFVNIDITRSN